MAAVLSGARVRVVTGTSYSTEADNVHVNGNHVSASAACQQEFVGQVSR